MEVKTRKYVPVPTLSSDQKELLINYFEQNPEIRKWNHLTEEQKEEFALSGMIKDAYEMICNVNRHLDDLANNDGVNFYSL